MSNKVKHRMKFVAPKFLAPVLTGILLAACASSDPVRRAPMYADMIDSVTYRVTCTDTSVREIYVRQERVDTFFRPDGSEKTREEFCRENAVGTRSL